VQPSEQGGAGPGPQQADPSQIGRFDQSLDKRLPRHSAAYGATAPATFRIIIESKY
jgi:hypothetical protein